MKRVFFTIALVLVAASPAFAANVKGGKAAARAPEWSLDATIIEACSCPMFCTCYFGGGHPAGHHNVESHSEEHFCRFNNAFKVTKGVYKGTKLDGAMFWVAGDLGGDFSHGEADWGTLTFDKTVTPAQREGIGFIVGKLYPANFKSFTSGEGSMSWVVGKEEAHALLDEGKTAEVALKKGGFGMNGEAAVIKNLQYWAANSNDGFVLWPNTVEAYRAGDKAFEFNGTNGFLITVHIHETPTAAAGEKGGE